MLKRIGAEESGEFKAIASGTLPSGKPVVVNADGTVSVAALSTLTQGVGSATVYESASSTSNLGVYDPGNNKVIIGYTDGGNSTRGTAVVGTVNGQSISFGTPVEMGTGNSAGFLRGAFDVNAGSVIFVYEDNSNGAHGTAIVGQVSGTSISFGSKTVFRSSACQRVDVAYDENAQKCVIIYQDSAVGGRPGKGLVATISGTSVSFGSASNISSSNHNCGIENIAYDASAQKVVVIWTNFSNSSHGFASVGTVSGTSISFGNQATFESGSTTAQKIVYDASAQKVLIAYKDDGDSDKGKCVVGTVSGTNISFGSIVVFDDSDLELRGITLAYDTNASKTVLSYIETGTSPNSGKNVPVTISGTTPSIGTATNFSSFDMQHIGSVYDPDQKKVVVVFADHAGTDTYHGTAKVFQNATAETNITSENYIGMSRGVVFESALSIGATSVVNTGTNGGQAIAYDTNSDRVVIAYKDTSNGHGKAVVGTVSGSGITFGTPVTFNAATTTGLQPSHGIAFDSSNNKVVIVYKDNGNSSHGTAIVGTVDPSDNSISYGSEAVFESAHATFPNVVFDSSNNKVLISYSDVGDSSKGKAIVGTVSGTSISFGSAAEFEGGDVNHETLMSTFDSANNKVVIAYKDVDDSNKGKAIVATISGTSVSFGTPVEFTASDFVHSSITFDSTSNKVILVYRDGGNSGYGTAKAGTVSGTSISFGNAIIYNSGDSQRNSVSYSPTADKSVVFFRDGADSDIGKLVEFTVSGTASSIQQFSATTTSASSSVFDPDNNVIVNAYVDEGNSTDLETVQVTGTTITRAEVANSGNASMDIIGSVSDNQIGLTAGQQYFVQNNGTIGETADSPSVLAGTAISATELLVKT